MAVSGDVVSPGENYTPVFSEGIPSVREFGSCSMSTSISVLATALVKAQAAIKGALKDVANPFFKAHYADLSSVWEACRGALTDNGLSVVQLPDRREGEIGVTTMLLHESGQFITSRISAKPLKDDPQQVGSAVTYLRRYGLAAMVGVVQVDDDGEGAMGRGGNKETPPPARAKPPQDSGVITDAMVRNLLIVAKKMGHTEDGVAKYCQSTHGVKTEHIPTTKYAEVLKRVGDKAPL